MRMYGELCWDYGRAQEIASFSFWLSYFYCFDSFYCAPPFHVLLSLWCKLMETQYFFLLQYESLMPRTWLSVFLIYFLHFSSCSVCVCVWLLSIHACVCACSPLSWAKAIYLILMNKNKISYQCLFFSLFQSIIIFQSETHRSGRSSQ